MCKLGLRRRAAQPSRGTCCFGHGCPGGVACRSADRQLSPLWGALSAGGEVSKGSLMVSLHSFLPKLFLNHLWVILLIL